MTEVPTSGESLTEFLAGLGWMPARRVGTELATAAWTYGGFGFSDSALAFVAQFDGLSFEYPRHSLVGGTDECVLDAVRAAGAINASRLHEYEHRAQQQLTPVGLAGSNHVVLMLSISGEMLGGYDDFLAIYGESGKQALWNIYHRVKPIRLP
ncbi:SUKH-3 domain-containing protein [Micromonospora sp. DT31]|uniref:SUKH-3 domain-containing protein n=1 Tax=Micromonospora sp. DT31 TaxID=3393434 RepID=UPI003CF2DDC8